MGEDRLNELDWVVWNLQLWDPSELVERDVGDRTAQGGDGVGGLARVRIRPVLRR